MRERCKKLIAFIVAITMLNQLPGFDVLIAQAESIYIDSETTISVDTEDTYVFASGGCTMTIDEGVSVTGIEISGYNTYTIDNGGSVANVTVEAGEAILNGGYYGSIYISEDASGGITANSISASTIVADGPIHLEGTNEVGALTSVNDLGGSGTVTVSDELSIPGTAATIIVGRNTVIDATNGDFVVYYNDTPYTIIGGSSGNTVEKNYGVYVSFETIDNNVDWTASTELDNLNTYLLPGEETGEYTCVATDGYYFPDTYTDMVTTTGQAIPTVTRVDEKNIQISYTVADTDKGTAIITLPALNPLETGMGSITVPDIYVGETYSPVVDSDTNPTEDVTVEYKVKGVSDETYSTTAPTTAGDYVARVILPAQGIYAELILTDEFSILKREGSATFAVEDIVYGGTITHELTSTTHDVDGAIIEYKLLGADDVEYSPDAPTEVGSYVARVTLLETAEYNKVELTDEFAILKAEGSAELSVADTVYGDEISVSLTSTTHDIATAVVEYMEAGADESTYTTIVPTAVGDYMIRISLAANESYNQVIKTAAFAILKAEGAATVTVEDVIYGETVAPVVISETHDVATAVVEYKLATEADTAYAEAVPTEAGNYVARVTFAQSEYYNAVTATTAFSINYLPIPDNAYSLVGSMGENGYYTSEVNIVAKDGYVISNSLYGEYVESITVASSSEAMTVYFMEKSTGAKTSGLSIAAIDIDVDAPQVDAKSDNTYYGDSLAVAISDNNLASVTLNGENIEIDGDRTVLELKSNGGVEEYTVVVTDNAGHTRNIVITVAAEWTKTGEIPNGTQVRLEAGTSYSLGSGTWTVDGDATSYSGNTTFYVSGESQFIFNQQ